METKILKEFIKHYKYGSLIMFSVVNKDLIVYWKHWSFVRWQDSPQIYLGKVKTKNLKPQFLWLD